MKRHEGDHHGGDVHGPAHLLSPAAGAAVNVGSVDRCRTPLSLSSSPPVPSPTDCKPFVDDRPAAVRPEVVVATAAAETTSPFVQRPDDPSTPVFVQSAPAAVGDWTGAWRTAAAAGGGGFEASPYGSWPTTYGLHPSAASRHVHPVGRVWQPRSADDQWPSSMSGIDRRYGGGLVQSWYSGYSRHTSPV